MSRLPQRLQPAWPLLKRVHRLLTFLLGIVFRRLSPLRGVSGLPTGATATSAETAAREPESVSLHPGGPAEHLVRGPAVGSPARHWVMERSRTADIPARYTLEVREGLVSGDFAAVVTPGRLLDYEVSGYFGIESWREHPVFLRPGLGTVERVPGTVLSLAMRGASVNYYHFLYDALARLGVFEESLPDIRVDAILVPHQTRYQRELLALAGVDAPLLQPRAGHTYQAERLLVPSTPNQELEAPRFVVDWLRRRLPASGRTDTPGRLFLTRGDKPNTRRYVEEPQLRPWLEANGFAVIDPGTLSVQAQIDHFDAAEIVVAPHGAGLTNITFCRPDTKVLELFAPSYVHLGLRNIADAVGLGYSYLVGDGSHREGKLMQGVYDDVSIPPARVQAAIAQLLAP